MDMSQYLDVFFEESKEHLANLNERLLLLEKNPRDLSSLKEIFRAAHTLKGMSSTMGFDNMADLTHHMENVLSELKEGIIPVSTGVVDVLFRCFDRLQVMMDNIQNGRFSEIDNSDLIDLLESIISEGGAAQDLPETVKPSWTAMDEEELLEHPDYINSLNMPFPLNDYDLTVLEEALRHDMKAYYILVQVDRGCLMKSVRVFMVFRALEEEGEIIKSEPPSQDLDEGRFDEEFHLVVITRSMDEEMIKKKIDGISEVKSGKIQQIILDNQAVQQKSSSPFKDEQFSVDNRNLETSPHDRPEEILRTHKVKQTVRVDIEKLDNLMNLVGELVINKGRLEQIGSNRQVQELNEAIEQMERITNDLQNVVMKVRMVPIEQVFNRFPRMVRDLAKELGKEINFVIEGKETELDRTVIDEIGDPLVHLLRNAVDHGIEDPKEREKAGKSRTGLVRLAAHHEGNNVFIEVEDDGLGIDNEDIRNQILKKGLLSGQEASALTPRELLGFLFEAGFSTSRRVTDVSGRGVGLDVVKNKIESLNGEVFVEADPGHGTRFKIRLPLTLAIIQALLVRIGHETYAIPLASVDETTIIEKHEIKMVQSQEVVVLRGNVLPLARGRILLGVPGEEAVDDEMYVVVVRKGGKQVGLVVNGLIGQQEIVIKNLGQLLIGLQGIAGATILGDGEVCLILDVGTLF